MTLCTTVAVVQDQGEWVTRICRRIGPHRKRRHIGEKPGSIRVGVRRGGARCRSLHDIFVSYRMVVFGSLGDQSGASPLSSLTATSPPAGHQPPRSDGGDSQLEQPRAGDGGDANGWLARGEAPLGLMHSTLPKYVAQSGISQT